MAMPSDATRGVSTPHHITLDLWPHPLTDAGRCTRLLPVQPGTTVTDLLRDHHSHVADELVVEVDGTILAPDDWARPLRAGAVVVLRPVGGDGLRTILQLAVIVAAIYVPTLGPIAAQAAWVGRAVSAGIMIGGNLVVNALVPPRVPSSDTTEDDPVYSLTAATNSVRPWQPMALVLGTHRLQPDFAAAAYTELRGEDEYLLQIFDFGLGDVVEVTDLRFGDTPLTGFQDLTLTWALAGADIATVGGDVHTLLVGAELLWPDETGATEAVWTTRRSAPGANRLAIQLVGNLFSVSSKGSVHSQSMKVSIAYRSIPTAAAQDPPWTEQTFTLTNDARALYRRTIELPVDAGQYDVRVRRVAAPPDNQNLVARMTWAGLQSHQAGC